MRGIIIPFALAAALAIAQTPANPPNGAALNIACGSATDQYFSPGSIAWTQTGAPVGYATLRYGRAFSYDVPLTNGLYLVLIGFIEPDETGPGQRVFTVTVNGQASSAIDLFALTGGDNLMYGRSFVALVGAGWLHLVFDGGSGNAVVSTISIAPVTYLAPPN